MLVLDKSASMSERLGGDSKWTAAVSAVTRLTTQDSRIRLGLAMFSDAESACSPGRIFVPIAANNAAEIQAALPAAADGTQTQLAGGLSVGAADLSLTDPARANGVVVITDGLANCKGSQPDPNSADDPRLVVQGLLARPVSVRTWVVGIGSGVDATMMTNMAILGGTARSVSPRYYQVDSAVDLQTALNEIAIAALSCTVTLSRTPPSGSSGLGVAINGQPVPNDPSRRSGWDLADTSLTLYGSACEALTEGGQLSVARK